MSKRQPKPFPYTTDPEQIPTAKIRRVCHGEDESECDYACPDGCWREHLDAWSRERRSGNKRAPAPQPWGHLMFKDPVGYASVPWGCTDPAVIRKAVERHIRAMLHGWDADLKKTADGRKRYEAIVAAQVEAKLAGLNTGATPFLACIMAGL